MRKANLKEKILKNLPTTTFAKTDKNYTLEQVKKGEISLDEFVATLTLDEAQLRKSKEPEEIRLKNLGLDPERSRSWFTYTDEEGAPAY